MKYLDPSFSQGLMERQQEIDHVLQAYLDEAIRSNAYPYDAEQFLKLHFLRKSVATLMKKRPPVNGVAAEVVETLQRFGAPLQEADRALFRRILTEANHLVASWGGQIYFVYLPTWERFRLPDLASKDRDAVLNLVKELGMRLIDLNPIFEQHPDPLSLFPTRRYAHYNDAGHALVAQEILRHLPDVGGPLSPPPAEQAAIPGETRK
jgi:hypothetical protein